MNFKALRSAAGLGNRAEFCMHTGISPRTLTDYDCGHSAPPIILIRYLRLLANGCSICAMRKRADITHPSETQRE